LRFGSEEVSATGNQPEEEPGEVSHEGHPGRARGQSKDGGDDGKHQHLAEAAQGHEPEQSIAESVRGEDVPEEGENGAAGTEDRGRSADPDGTERRVEHDLGDASERTGRHEEDVKPDSTGGSFEWKPDEGEGDRVREEVCQPAVGVDARDDGPGPNVDGWCEDEQEQRRSGGDQAECRLEEVDGGEGGERFGRRTSSEHEWC